MRKQNTPTPTQTKSKFTTANLSVMNFGVATLPQMKEVRGKDYIYYGEQNDYPYYLIDLINGSAKHNAIVTGKVNYIVGQGLEYAKTGDTLSDAKTQQFMQQANRFETLEDVYKKIAFDFEVSNLCYLKIVPNMAKSGIAEIYHIDFSKCRLNKDRKKVFIGTDWCKTNNDSGERFANAKAEYNEYPVWDYKSLDKEYIAVVTSYRPNLQTYALPDYAGCLTWIEVDKRIGKFHMNNINNGFTASALINFNNGQPEPEEQKKIEKKINDKFTSEDNAGKFVLTFSDDNTKAPTIQTLQASDLDKQFDILNKTAMQEIITGHKVTSGMLFGIAREGQLGGRTEIVEAYQLFINTYIELRRPYTLDLINEIMRINKLSQVTIQNTKPIGITLSEQTLKEIMTKDELRKEAGLPPLEEVKPTPTIMSKVEDKGKQLIKELEDAFELDENETVTEFTIEDWDNVESIKQAHLENFAFGVEDPKGLKKAIIETLQLNPSITVSDLAKLTDERKEDIVSILKKLEKDGYIESNKKGAYVVTEKGTNYAIKILDVTKKEDTPLQEYELYTVWQYRVKPGVPSAKQSREFCVAMMKLTDANKTITEDKIQAISEKYYGNAWEALAFKGGWYTNPKTEVTTRDCRHEWKAVIKKRVIKK